MIASLADPLPAEEAQFLDSLDAARAAYPGNLCARYLSRELFLSFAPAERDALYRACRSGADNPDSHVGCYIRAPEDLQRFDAVFAPLIRARHASAALTPPRRAPAGELDLAALGLPALSTRVRLCRNLAGWSLPASMDRGERLALERVMVGHLQCLVDDPAYGGRIYSLSPNLGGGRPNPNLIEADRYDELVAAGLMFRPMDADPYMLSAGLAADWPYGRACYISADQAIMVWIGEEDHLRLISVATSTRLSQALDQLRALLSLVASLDGVSFLTDPAYGYVTSCPSNLGSGLRASVRMSMPERSSSETETTERCRRLGLAAAGLAGDRAPMATSGPIDLSPIRRLWVSDREMFETLYDGLGALTAMSH